MGWHLFQQNVGKHPKRCLLMTGGRRGDDAVHHHSRLQAGFLWDPPPPRGIEPAGWNRCWLNRMVMAGPFGEAGFGWDAKKKRGTPDSGRAGSIAHPPGRNESLSTLKKKHQSVSL